MRTPAQASVNVIAREDLPRMREEAKYRGMEATFDRLADRAIMSILIALHAQDQLDRLRKTIEDESANILLRSGCGHGFANGCAFAAWLKLQHDGVDQKAFECMVSRNIDARSSLQVDGGVSVRTHGAAQILIHAYLAGSLVVSAWPKVGTRQQGTRGCCRRDAQFFLVY